MALKFRLICARTFCSLNKLASSGGVKQWGLRYFGSVNTSGSIESSFWNNLYKLIYESGSSYQASKVNLYHNEVIKLLMGYKSTLLKEGALRSQDNFFGL